MNENLQMRLKTGALFLLFFGIIVVCPMIPSPQFGGTSIGNIVAPLILLLLTHFLYKKESKSLSELGLNSSFGNISFMFTGLFVGIAFFCILLFLQSFQNGLSIKINPNANWLPIVGGLFFLIISVLNEELIFRGYCFKRTIHLVGTTKANLIFTFLFVVYHWIALNAWGNWSLMLGLCTTGFGHFLFATALLKSHTLYFPIGIHLGNNWAQRHLFSAQMGGINVHPSNDTFLILSSSQQETSLLLTLFNYGVSIFWFLLATWVIWKWTKRH